MPKAEAQRPRRLDPVNSRKSTRSTTWRPRRAIQTKWTWYIGTSLTMLGPIAGPRILSRRLATRIRHTLIGLGSDSLLSATTKSSIYPYLTLFYNRLLISLPMSLVLWLLQMLLPRDRRISLRLWPSCTLPMSYRTQLSGATFIMKRTERVKYQSSPTLAQLWVAAGSLG